jgi:hypothetical protein
MGFVWEDYIFNNKNIKPINISVYVVGGICIFSAIVACFMQCFLPNQAYNDILSIKWFCITMTGLFGIFSIICALINNRLGICACYALLVIITSAFGTKLFYNMDYNFGQKDLMEYAKFAKENGKKIVILNDERKYSVLYYYGFSPEQRVYYITLTDTDEMSKIGDIIDDNDVLVIIRNKEMDEVDETLNFDTISQGKKFSLVKVYAK